MSVRRAAASSGPSAPTGLQPHGAGPRGAIPCTTTGSCSLSRRSGLFRYGVLKDALIAGALANITGYPQDKPPGTLWGHAKTLRPPGLRSLTYEIDTFGGMSGAPVVMWDGRDYLAIGIHNYGEANANSASRITEDVFHNLERWKSFAAEA